MNNFLAIFIILSLNGKIFQSTRVKKLPQLIADNTFLIKKNAEPKSEFEVSFDEFKNSLLMNNFSEPTWHQYANFTFYLKITNSIQTKREAGMFLAQIIHESMGLKFKKEIVCKKNECAGSYPVTPGIGNPHKFYYGRGYIQLTWDFNYKEASFDLFNDDRLIQDPDQVADKEEVSWLSAFWFWETKVSIDTGVKMGNFGSSTNRINGILECRGHNLEKARKRFEYYTTILKIFEINEKPKESGCYN
ncbi:chitinase 4-like [Brachionus plicatilis]|uniref:Chitinase 4-like n=1 Tax=Brachionus plicatilis TaxID=10195 RepID=A0A3M7Q777_BRAPC|nr:chitinase 4-like [Brachionus plicatilis]